LGRLNEATTKSKGPAMSSPAVEEAAPQRIIAIDALRGFDMFWITGGQPLFLALSALLLMKFPGVHEALDHQFHHVLWGERLVFWDLIMPLFLFIVGASMPFSFSRRQKEGQSKSALYRKILTRVAILWVLGMVKQGNLLHLDLGRLMFYSNTLQAIAAGYLIGGIVLLNTGIRGQAIATVTLLLLYWALLALVPFGGNPGGTITPELNLAQYADAAVFGDFTDKSKYTWGLSSLGFAATTLFGILAGHTLRSDRDGWKKLYLLIGAGVGLVLLGELWNFVHPINKYIWTSSMTVWTAGWCYLMLAAFYLLIDLWGFRKFAFPFIVLGANALVAYMADYFIRFKDIAALLFHGEARMGVSGTLLQAFAAFMILWLGLYWMYKKRIFVRI
jgi:predicted acyltransferase